MSNGSIWPTDTTLIRCYHFGPEWTSKRWQWRGTRYSPKLQHYRILTIRLFSVISGRSLVVVVVGCSYVSAEMQLVYFTSANRLGWFSKLMSSLIVLDLIQIYTFNYLVFLTQNPSRGHPCIDVTLPSNNLNECNKYQSSLTCSDITVMYEVKQVQKCAKAFQISRCSTRGRVAKVTTWEIVVSEFEL